MDYADDMPVLMNAADLVISRSGAIALTEIAACGKAGVLVPSPNVTDNHQFYNAKAVKWLKQDWHPTVVRAAMGVMIEDNYLENPDFALSCIEPVIKAAIKNNLYVIVDWHSHEMLTDEAVKFFGNRHCNRTTDTAADNTHFTDAFGFGGNA